MQSDVNKRRAERRKKARKKHLLFTGLILLILSLIVLVILCFTVFFSVKNVSVSGTEVYTVEQVKKACGLTEKDNLLIISQKKIEKQLRKALPYVDSIQIERDFPNGVNIIVTDATPYSFYIVGNEYCVISTNGYIIDKKTEVPNNIFELCTGGIEGNLSEKAVYTKKTEEEIVNELITSLTANNVKINKIDVTNIVQITIKVEDRFDVLLGTKDNINEKIKHLARVIAEHETEKGTINLSMWTPENKQSQLKLENK